MVEKPAEPKAGTYSLGKVIADMAKATGDKNLQKMATIYTIPDTHRRPDTIEKLRSATKPKKKTTCYKSKRSMATAFIPKPTK